VNKPVFTLLATIIASSPTHAASPTDRYLEEVIVTAQRVEQSAQDVPMSVSAFTDTDLKDRQIIGIWDLQANVPNLTYTQENFGSSKLTIRGVGNLALGSGGRYTSSPSAPIYLNGVSTSMAINVLEFYDMERVEVIRGPQSTLYGRNATAGAINLATNRPDFSGVAGYLDVEYGDYDHTRTTAAINLPLGDRIALRAAGMKLSRDGYIENKAADDIPGIHDDMDSRHYDAHRLTLEWHPMDKLTAWLMYSNFSEDDSKVRIHNQVCKTNDLPTTGCVPNAFGLEPTHPGARLDVFVASAVAGAIPLGARDAESGLAYEFPRPSLDLRSQHDDVNPSFKHDEKAWLISFEWSPGPFVAELNGSYFDTSNVTRQGRFNEVGFVLNPTPENPSGLWPVADIPIQPLGSDGGVCDINTARAGKAEDCILGRNLNRAYDYDQVSNEHEFKAAEARVRTQWDSVFNLLAGATWSEQERKNDFALAVNTLGVISSIRQPQLYPPYAYGDGTIDTKGTSIFAEAYLDFSDTWKLTLGVRRSKDEMTGIARTSAFAATNVAPTGAEPKWVRSTLLGYATGAPSEQAQFLADYYGAAEAIASATDITSLIDALRIVPFFPLRGESSDLLGWPKQADWVETTTRVAIEWHPTDETLLYAQFGQGYRPGIINQPIPSTSFARVTDAERVNAFEIGTKMLLAEGALAINVAAFVNDYRDLQFFRTFHPLETAVDNLDAKTRGLELEIAWRPHMLPGTLIEFNYGWLDTEFGSETAIDRTNRTQGDPNLVLLSDMLPGPVMWNYVAPLNDVLPQIDDAIAAGAAVPAPGAVYGNGVPIYFSRAFLDANGVSTANAVPARLSGNDLPNSPPHSIGLGLAHSWSLAAGTLTLRYDYYWQDESYSREFNTKGDEIDSWDQHNASIIFESANGRWSARAWVRNFTDEENVTGHFVHADDAGLVRNYFLAEPRIFGASVRYNFIK